MKTHPLDSRDRELGRLREKLGESTMELELLREQIGRLETSHPVRVCRLWSLLPAGSPLAHVRMTNWWTTSGAS